MRFVIILKNELNVCADYTLPLDAGQNAMDRTPEKGEIEGEVKEWMK